MTPDDFTIWWSDYREKFPSVSRWLNDLGHDQAQAQLKLWRSILSGTPLRQALQVSHDMSHGDLEPVKSYDSERERTAVYIKRAVAERMAAKEKHEKPADDYGPPRYPARRRAKRDAVPMREAMSMVERLIKSGRDSTEAVDEAMPSDDFDFGRFKCLRCRDSGLVTVWASMSVRAGIDDPALLDERENRRTCVAPCSCEKGRPKVWDVPSQGTPPRGWAGWTGGDAVYCESTHCIVEGNKHSESAREHLKLWIEERKRSIDRQKTKQLSDGLFD